MIRHLLAGAAAGALGTVALNVVSYLDMVVRARPSSSMPARTAGRLADELDIDLAPGVSGDERDQVLEPRTQGAGALLGYLTGLGVGTAYGALRSNVSVPRPAAAVALTGAVMAGSDIPATLLGVTDPTEWQASSWAADIVPHAAYGMVTAIAFDALTNPSTPTIR